MITLHWRQVGDLRLEAQHRDWLLSIDRPPNWTRAAPAMVYDYTVAALNGQSRYELRTFTDSAAAKCAAFNFINSQQEVSTPCQ